MKLFGHDTSPYVRRVRALLAELGLPFERDTAGWQDPSPCFNEASPVKKVPALEVTENGETLVLLDSKTIAAWVYERALADAKPAGVTPVIQRTLFDRATRFADENVLTTSDNALDSAIALFLYERDGLKREDVPMLKRQAARLETCLAALDRVYDGKTTLHDGSFGFVDLSVFCLLDWLVFRKARSPFDFPHLKAFYEAHAKRPSLVSTDPRLG
ncbi:MAG TPA: glutathione S-transferase family protein [Polyangiaceae bacterium]